VTPNWTAEGDELVEAGLADANESVLGGHEEAVRQDEEGDQGAVNEEPLQHLGEFSTRCWNGTPSPWGCFGSKFRSKGLRFGLRSFLKSFEVF